MPMGHYLWDGPYLAEYTQSCPPSVGGFSGVITTPCDVGFWGTADGGAGGSRGRIGGGEGGCVFSADETARLIGAPST
jgi:hypothetical protein